MIEYDPLDNKPRYSGQEIAELIAERTRLYQENERLQGLANTAEKWKGIAQAKYGDAAELIAERNERIADLEEIERMRDLELSHVREAHGNALIRIDEQAAEIERLKADLEEQTGRANGFSDGYGRQRERAEAVELERDLLKYEREELRSKLQTAERALANAKREALREIIASLQQQDDVPK